MVVNRLQPEGGESPFPSYDENTPASLRPGALLAVDLGKNRSSPLGSIKRFVARVHAFAPYADVLSSNDASDLRQVLESLYMRVYNDLL